ncbi:MAG: GNAT family N-acetyltransferase [Acetatifactor sp.]|nr:GNAT family N-acetyltransferase [Acetatifactor sp.]
MEKKMYLKRLIIVLKNGETLAEIYPVTEDLKEAGVSSFALLADELLENPALVSQMGTEEFLFLTDDTQVAELTMRENRATLAYLHAGGDSDFSTVPYGVDGAEGLDVEFLERVYRRHAGISWDILETDRCSIRETTVEDVDAFVKIYSDPEIVRYTEELYPEVGKEKEYIRQYIEKVYQYFEFGVWTVQLKKTGEIIGRAGFSVRDGYTLPELGFIIAKKWQNKGIATEICSAILAYGKEYYGFDKVQLLVRPENEASIALCKKLGFQEEKQVREGGKEYLYMVWKG